VHSVDRPELVEALAGRDLDVLLQVDLGAGESAGRGGARPGAVPALAEQVRDAEGLRLRGVMAVAPLGVPAVTAFTALGFVADRVRAVEPSADWLSAGMSGDYAEAIAAGATHIRIGTAITGPRPAA
jgi:uncharacterized pyridoxal phosphate-containing UPF0001 family protein